MWYTIDLAPVNRFLSDVERYVGWVLWKQYGSNVASNKTIALARLLSLLLLRVWLYE